MEYAAIMAQMKIKFPCSGEWWLPGAPELKHAGELRYTSQNGASLEIVGRLCETYNEDGHPWLHGLILGLGKVSLYGCRLMETQGTSLEIGGETYDCAAIFEGDYFEDDTAVFDEARIEFDSLGQFVNQERIDVLREEGIVKAILTAEPDLELLTNTDVTVRLVHGMTSKRTDSWVTLKQETEIVLTFAVTRSLSEVRTLAVDIGNALTLCMGRPLNIRELCVSKRSANQWFPVFVPNWRVDGESHVRGNVLARLPELIAMNPNAIGHWISILPRYRPIVDLALSGVYNPRTYLENDLVNLINALEGFHRRKFGNSEMTDEAFQSKVEDHVESLPKEKQEWIRNKLRYRNETPLFLRLVQLRKFVGIPSKGIDDLSDEIISRIVATRNYMTHYDQARKSEGIKADDYHRLRDMLRTWVSCAFLREMGASEEFARRKFMMYERRFVGWLARNYGAISPKIVH